MGLGSRLTLSLRTTMGTKQKFLTVPKTSDIKRINHTIMFTPVNDFPIFQGSFPTADRGRSPHCKVPSENWCPGRFRAFGLGVKDSRRTDGFWGIKAASGLGIPLSANFFGLLSCVA